MIIRGRAFALIAVILLGMVACGDSRQPDHDGEDVSYELATSLTIGSTVPDFQATSLDHPEVVFSPQYFDGKVLLIDFWATWCLPCIAELPNLHEAYETYASKGFEILSIALGDDPEEIARLREREWPMPWSHAHEPLGGELSELFDVFGVPKAVLINTDHTIIGIDEDIRGDRLVEQLERIFSEID